MKRSHLICIAAMALLCATGFWSEAEELRYVKDQAIDRQLGLLDRSWRINRVRLNTRGKQPPQVHPTFPPYSQQPEDAQTAPIPSPM